jgi:hypothetical protein
MVKKMIYTSISEPFRWCKIFNIRNHLGANSKCSNVETLVITTNSASYFIKRHLLWRWMRKMHFDLQQKSNQYLYHVRFILCVNLENKIYELPKMYVNKNLCHKLGVFLCQCCSWTSRIETRSGINWAV